jgi:hypothetical protein
LAICERDQKFLYVLDETLSLKEYYLLLDSKRDPVGINLSKSLEMTPMLKNKFND